MKVSQHTWSTDSGWDNKPALQDDVRWVLVFGGRDALRNEQALRDLKQAYPAARLTGCTTAGEIAHTHVTDDHLVATAVRFDGHVDCQVAHVEGDSIAAGKAAASALDPNGLRHIIVLSDGLGVNGTDLVEGMHQARPGVPITGGLAGDGALFEETYTMLDGDILEDHVIAIGLYGERLQTGFGSMGGWDAFGPQRRITKSKDNVLLELDGQPALQLYKKYLGEHVDGLPATGLLFPLSIEHGQDELVRTILAVDEDAQSLTFAGDIPIGAKARLMKANFDRLVDGAHGAAEHTQGMLGGDAELALLISCVGRKLVLKQRTEDELEAVHDVLGGDAAMCGFYSYGEICPAAPDADCSLHNQTMTITTFKEV